LAKGLARWVESARAMGMNDSAMEALFRTTLDRGEAVA
jgi:hypothetical protein